MDIIKILLMKDLFYGKLYEYKKEYKYGEVRKYNGQNQTIY